MEGTLEYMAPEVASCEDISLQTDQWSLGVLSFVLLSGYSPFLQDPNNPTMTIRNVKTAKYDFDYKEFDEVSADAKDFLTRLLRKRPSHRMTASACLEHRWLNEKQMSGKITRIKVTNLRKYLAKRKVQNVAVVLRVTNVFKGAARDSRSISGSFLNEKEGEADAKDTFQDNLEHGFDNCTQETSGDDENDQLAAFNKERDTFDEVLAKKKREPNEISSHNRTISKAAPGTVKMLMANYTPKNLKNEEDDLLAAFKERDTFYEVLLRKKREPTKMSRHHRNTSKAAPGTVKKLMENYTQEASTDDEDRDSFDDLIVEKEPTKISKQTKLLRNE
eukprot:GFUD01030152.1.p1 GENE.GFUD01030152.1~~GFUD01030152.1.p1  ORF type:complete len:385 (-),score=95.28 GFUD01030152.1:32-1030(-)